MKERSEYLTEKIKEIKDNPFSVPLLRVYVEADRTGKTDNFSIREATKKEKNEGTRDI